MHFLICIGGETYSKGTLTFGMSLAWALGADVSILYVRPRVSYRFRVEVRLAREKLQSWQLETPEIQLMQGIERILLEEGFLRTVRGEPDVKHAAEAHKDVYEYHLYGKQGQNVRIRFREGDVVGSILRETLDVSYDLVVVGAPGDGGSLVRRIMQYVGTSVLIVKNPQPFPYRLLLCLNDSRAARKAEQFAVRAASLLKTTVDILCVYVYPWEEHSALNLAESARRLMKRHSIQHSVRLRRGAVARSIIAEAQPDHLIVMGESERSSLYQFFFGSNPVRIGKQGSSPVLVVK
jgi:nucleotide-binding universal stress UspA family protein